MNDKRLRVALLDLNAGQPNQGMRCLREILSIYNSKQGVKVDWDEYDVRVNNEVPDLSYDVYLSSGGPGSPLESEGSEWENKYFDWIKQVEEWNADEANLQKKYVFFICHSFQLACRYFKIATVCKRNSTSFGIFPIHMISSSQEVVFQGLNDPFYSVDSRDFQVVKPNHNLVREMGGAILALEKERPHVPYERAVMAIRFNDYMIGTQFHPEADAVGMSMYLQREDKKQAVIHEHGEEKWNSMIKHLNDPDKISLTYSHIIPNFLSAAIA
ncbi:MAG: GMP synthase [Williamsia sp.]|nr:GMP synthase [Williamsia sp.]